MRIEGRSNDYIAEQLDVKKRTVVFWWMDDKVQAEIDRLMQDVENKFVERLATLGMVALDQQEQILKEPHRGDITPGMKLQIVESVLDRISATSRTKDLVEANGKNGDVNVNIMQDMTDGQLLQQARALASRIVDSDAEELPDGDD
jgi:hypothetical protein